MNQNDDLEVAVEALAIYGSQRKAAKALGISRDTLRHRVDRARAKLNYHEPVDGFATPVLPTGDMPTEELIEFMTSSYIKRKKADTARKPIPIKMSDDQPVGLMFFGDPHVDSPQCDWPELRRCVAICQKTEGMRGVSLGDHTDNWIGRLQAEYAKSNATTKQAWQLADWFITSIDPLLIIKGNHDAWSGSGDPLEYIRGPGNIYENWQAMIELLWPNGKRAVLDVRHDHPGGSQWHPLHGQVKEARYNKSGLSADIYIAGHRHTWGMMTTEMQGRVVHMCRAKGFKGHGEYEEVKGFEAQHLGHTITAVFDPDPVSDAGFISVFAEPQEAAEFLTYKRGR
jgi:hypothetical protein